MKLEFVALRANRLDNASSQGVEFSDLAEIKMKRFRSRGTIQRKRIVKRSQSLTLRSNHFAYESLEERRLLAGLGNIEITDARLADGNLAPLATPVVGQMLLVHSFWDTTDLPGNASYQVGFEIDGVQLIGGVTTVGAGLPASSGNWYHLGWYATPGTHTVEVTVDIFNTVAESNESDNTFTFQFTPVTATPNFQMAWPLEGEPFQDYALTNYNDIDPTGGVSDFTGSNATYNGHTAIDAGPVTFQEMDEGIPLLAAADGVVSFVNDGAFDRQTTFNPDPVNYVYIDHGNGWETGYLHMRRDSLQVDVGDFVSKGDFIGMMGSSGNSTGNHIHFSLTHNRLPIETMLDPNTFWESPHAYVGDDVYVFGSGVTNYSPTAHGLEGASQVVDWKQQSGQLTYVWANFSGLRQNDFIQYQWFRPNNTIWTSGAFNSPQDYSNAWFWFSRFLPSNPDLGTWRVDFLVNGVKKGEQFFEVSPDGAPEIRVEDLSTNIILDDRYTPLDFGTPLVGASDPTQTFRVFNHGFDTLTTSNLTVPENYYVVEGLSTSIAPGGSDTFTIALDTAVAGYQAGEVRFDTNDADESDFNFSVEGLVSSPSQNEMILGISHRRTDEFTSLKANLRRLGSTAAPLSVTIDGDSDGPRNVVFPAGADYVSFDLNFGDASSFDPFALITATATGYSPAQNEIVIVDTPGVQLPFGVDFGPQGSPVYQDYVVVDETFAYSPQSAYGWMPDLTTATSFEFQRGTALGRDGVSLRLGTFVVDVPDGDYHVDLNLGVVRKTDRIEITIEGNRDEFVPNPGPNVSRSYTTTVTDGQLSIYLDGLPGLNNKIRVSGIYISPVSSRDSGSSTGNKTGLASVLRPTAHEPLTEYENVRDELSQMDKGFVDVEYDSQREWETEASLWNVIYEADKRQYELRLDPHVAQTTNADSKVSLDHLKGLEHEFRELFL